MLSEQQLRAAALIDRPRLRWFAIGSVLLVLLQINLLSLLNMSFFLALLRAELGLLCIWLMIGIDRLSLRLAVTVLGCSALYLLSDQLLRQNDQHGIWSYAIVACIVAHCPLLCLTVAGVLQFYQLNLPSSAHQTGTLSRLHWFQFSVFDFFVWTVAVAVAASAILSGPDLFSDLLNQITDKHFWEHSVRLSDTLGAFYLYGALPTAASVLIGAWYAKQKSSLVWKLGMTGFHCFAIGLLVEFFWLLIHLLTLWANAFAAHEARLPEFFLQPVIGIVVLLACWWVAGYDALYAKAAKHRALLATARM